MAGQGWSRAVSQRRKERRIERSQWCWTAEPGLNSGLPRQSERWGPDRLLNTLHLEDWDWLLSQGGAGREQRDRTLLLCEKVSKCSEVPRGTEHLRGDLKI